MNRFPFRRLIAIAHLWAGLVLGIPLVLLGLSGSVLVFEDDIRAAFSAAPPPAATGAPHSIDDILAAARAAAPRGFAPNLYFPADEPGGLASVRLSPTSRGGPETGIGLEIDPVSLAIYRSGQGPAWLRSLSALHSTLLLHSQRGRGLVGGLGIAMLLLGVTGLVNRWPGRARWRAAFTMRRGRGRIGFLRELHGVVGMWGWLVFILVSFGGVYLAFPQPVNALMGAKGMSALRGPAAVTVQPIPGVQPMSPGEAVELARSQIPEGRLSALFLAGGPRQPIRISFARQGEPRVAPSITLWVDPWSRQIVRMIDPRAFTPVETFLAWQRAIHAGVGLGWVWKILVALSGLMPALFVITGATMWLGQRRRRKLARLVVPTPSTQPAPQPVEEAAE